MREVTLRVPIVQATQWSVEDKLTRLTDKRNVEYDGGEEQGDWEIHTFAGVSTNDVMWLAQRVLPKAVGFDVVGNVVTVTVPTQGWLQVLGPVEHPYDRALRRLCRQLSESATWQSWWAFTSWTRALIVQTDRSQQGDRTWEFEADDGTLTIGAWVDLGILDRPKPTRDEITAAARANLGLIMDELAKFLQRKRPELFLQRKRPELTP